MSIFSNEENGGKVFWMCSFPRDDYRMLLTICVINHFLFQVSNFFYDVWIKSQDCLRIFREGKQENKCLAVVFNCKAKHMFQNVQGI